MSRRPRLLGRWGGPSDPEWNAARTGRLGASEIAAVVGLSPWQSAFSLWHLKRGAIAGDAMSSPMTVGTYVESAIANWFADQHPECVVRTAGTYAHAERDWQLCNPDRLVSLGPRRKPCALLECKYSTSADEWGDEGTDQIPAHYLAQVQWQMDVMGVDECHVAVLLPGRFAEYVVRANADDQDFLREAGRAFLASIEAEQAPPIDDSLSTRQAIRRLHPAIDDVTVPVDSVVAAAYAQASRDLDRARRAHRGLQSVLLHQMGSARRGAVDGISVLRRQPAHGGGVALHQITRHRERTSA